MSLQGHVAFVSGAGRNIGREIALEFARAGADLVLNTRRNRDELADTAREARALGVRTITLLGDVGQSADVSKMAESALAEFGKVDIVVNNAAIRPEKPFLEITDEDWRQVIGIDLDAAFYTCRAFLPGMLAQNWGRIINLTGVNAMTGYATRAHVSAAKHGVWGLTKSLAKAYGANGVTANVVSPGVIDTIRSSPAADTHFSREVSRIPVGRQGRVEEIATLCAYLASDAAAFLTGQMIGVNGGQTT